MARFVKGDVVVVPFPFTEAAGFKTAGHSFSVAHIFPTDGAYMIDVFSEGLNWFWDLVNKSQQDRSKLESVLVKLDRKPLQLFIDAFEEAALRLNGTRHLKYVRANVSEDGVDDITHWVVSQGKEYFMRVVEHPELMPAYIALDNPQNLWGIADYIYEERFGDLEDNDF